MAKFTKHQQHLITAIQRLYGHPVARSATANGLGSDSAPVRTVGGVLTLGLSPERPRRGGRATGGNPLSCRQVDIEELIQADLNEELRRSAIVNKFTQNCLKCAVSNTAHLSQIETKP